MEQAKSFGGVSSVWLNSNPQPLNEDASVCHYVTVSAKINKRF
jgi:hypothetical protein